MCIWHLKRGYIVVDTMDTQKSWEIPVLNFPTSRLAFTNEDGSLQIFHVPMQYRWSATILGKETKKIDCGIGDLTKIHEEYKVIVGNVISSPVFLILVLPTKGMSNIKALLKVPEEKRGKAAFVVRVCLQR